MDVWTEHTSFSDDLSPVTCIEYDNCYDMMWQAHVNGRLSCYTFTDELQYAAQDEDYFPSPPNMFKFSSLPVVADGIVQVLPNQNTVVAVGCSKIRLLTHGGSGLGNWSIDHCPNPTRIGGITRMLSRNEAAFTCADLIRDPTLSRTSSAYAATSLIAGTSTNAAYLFDLSQGIDSPVMVYNVAQPTVKIQSNGHIMVAAGQDGSLRILDGKFRSNEVNRLIEAHTGSICDVSMQADGHTLVTCGTTKRAINPYDPKSPFHYGSDVQIRVFDMRMYRMITPLPVTAPSASTTGVSVLRLIPQVDTDPVEFASLLMCTADGIVQVSSLTADPNAPEAHQVLYAPLSDASEMLTAAAVSPSGQFLAVGTSSGTVGQYVKPSVVAMSALAQRPQGMKCTELYRVNELSPHGKTGPARDVPTPAPLLSLSVDTPSLGTAYVLNTPQHTPQMLSSSYAMTPAVVKRKLRLVPTSRISDELLSKCSARQDFIRIIPNPGFRPNSMKNVPKAAPTVSMVNGATINPPYAVCDPRKIQILQQQQAQMTGLNAPGGGGSGGPGAGSGRPGLPRSNSRQDSLDGLGSGGGDASSAGSAGGTISIVPKHYLKPSSLNSASKQRFKKFDYASVNDTPFVGLENNVPNSLINPILQLCYSLPSLRDQALQSQSSPYHHQDAGQGSILCEMGFLFHMMRLVAEYSQPKRRAAAPPGSAEVDKVVRAANFQRIFQTLQLIPEAVALSLFDETLQSDLQQFIQVLTPFLLRRLVLEIDQENAAANGNGANKRSKWAANPSRSASTATNVVDDIFGFSTLSSTTFLHSGVHKVDPKHNRALVLDLVYPSLTSSSSGASRRPTPASKAATSPVPSAASAADGQAPALASPVRVAATYKVTGKKSRNHASFAAVLWGSFQREMSMKGWCAESDAFEPFKKMQSLVSLPRVLTLLCGNTQADVKDSTTLAGALGETIGQGNTHTNYWSCPVLVTLAKAAAAAAGGAPSDSVDPLLGVPEGGSREFAWLPAAVEVAYRVESEAKPTQGLEIATPGAARSGARLVVSCRCVPYSTSASASYDATKPADVWIVFDGSKEDVIAGSASSQPAYDFLNNSAEWSVHTYDLQGLVLQVSPGPAAASSALPVGVVTSSASAGERRHLVLQLNTGDSADTWHLFNDFVVQKIPLSDVVTFPTWKHPCMVCFARRDAVSAPPGSPVIPEKMVVPASVLQLESLSRTPSIRLLQSFATLPGPGDLIAFDGEFVSVSLEKSMINAAGERVVSEEVRQVLARISLLDMGHGPRDTEQDAAAPGSPPTASAGAATAGPDGPGSTVFNKNMMRIIADDYILPVEPVLDYVTRFSGITEEDLNPQASKHSILTQRAAYLKLRYFIDAKCVFVGHGLQKDFETANIFVPPEQIRDTVELWRLPNQRKISLRFLASYVLKEDIQDEIHDSIEDAKTSLLLYRKYKALAQEGPERINAVLQELYAYGNRNNWTIGMEKLNAGGK